MLLYEIVDIFDEHKLKYALIGGYALALHGLVRATMDIDIAIHFKQKDFEVVENALAQIGLKSRLPIRAQDMFKMRQEYIENRNLIVWSFVDYDNPARQVDILITQDLSELETEKISIGGKKISIISLKELLRMKTESGRPQDLLDIKNIREKLNEKK